MAYNLPPPPVDVPNAPLPPLGLGGIGLPGFGKSFNFDFGTGFGYPGIGLGGIPPIGLGGLPEGGFPGWAPYVPISPLGGLGAIKGDLIVPIVAIGVAIFILVLIVLAVKYALAWKLEVLDELGGIKKWRRDADNAAAPQLEDSNLNKLADIVAAAVYSEGCSRRILCEMGSYARENKQHASLIRLMELVVPEEYQGSFTIVRESAEGSYTCGDQYPCGDVGAKAAAVADNEVDVGAASNKTAPLSALNQTAPEVANNASTPSETASIFGKFKRAMI